MLGRVRHRESEIERARAPEGEKQRRWMPIWEARPRVQPKKKSEMMAEGGEGWDPNQSRIGVLSSLKERIIAMSLFSDGRGVDWS